MKKKYLIIFMTSILGLHLQASDVVSAERQKDTDPSVLIASEMPLSEEKLHSKKILLVALEKMNNGKVHSVLIVPETVSDEILNIELKKFGFSTNLITIFEKNNKGQFFNVILPAAGCGLMAGTFSAIIWLLGNILVHPFIRDFTETLPLDLDVVTSSLIVGFGAFVGGAMYMGSLFSKMQNDRNHLKQIKNINFKNQSVSVLKVPKRFVGITVQFLIEQGFHSI